MKKLVIVTVFGLGMFFALQYFRPDFASTLVNLGGAQVAWGWVLIAASAAVGFGLVVSKK